MLPDNRILPRLPRLTASGHVRKFIILPIGALLGLAAVGLGQDRPPDLVAIKAAAEAGDPKAQYEYGKAIPYPRIVEQFDWYLKSACAGYAPAQDALGNHFAAQIYDKQKHLANLRESVRWSSRAAYQGVMWSQARIAGFYHDGEVLPKDLVAAYVWCRIAKNSSPLQIGFTGELNRLVTEMSSAEIAEAENRLKSFRLEPYSGLNPIEADMLFAQVKISATYVMNGVRQVVLDNVRFNQGETKDVILSGESIRLTCLSIQETGVLVGIAGTPYTRWLKR